MQWAFDSSAQLLPSRVLSTHGYIRQLILGYFLSLSLSLSSFYLLFLSLSSLLYYIYTRIYIYVCAFLHSYLIWKTEDSRLVSPAWVVCFFLLLLLSPINSLCPLTLASSFLRTWCQERRRRNIRDIELENHLVLLSLWSDPRRPRVDIIGNLLLFFKSDTLESSSRLLPLSLSLSSTLTGCNNAFSKLNRQTNCNCVSGELADCEITSYILFSSSSSFRCPSVVSPRFHLDSLDRSNSTGLRLTSTRRDAIGSSREECLSSEGLFFCCLTIQTDTSIRSHNKTNSAIDIHLYISLSLLLLSNKLLDIKAHGCVSLSHLSIYSLVRDFVGI